MTYPYYFYISCPQANLEVFNSEFLAIGAPIFGVSIINNINMEFINVSYVPDLKSPLLVF